MGLYKLVDVSDEVYLGQADIFYNTSISEEGLFGKLRCKI